MCRSSKWRDGDHEIATLLSVVTGLDSADRVNARTLNADTSAKTDSRHSRFTALIPKIEKALDARSMALQINDSASRS